MSLKLYYDLMSQPARAVYMFLRVNNIKFEAKRVDLKNGTFSKTVAMHSIKYFFVVSIFQKLNEIKSSNEKNTV
jgi:hypothetical protein